MTQSGVSTTPAQLQMQRLKREKRRAAERAANQQKRLRALNRESSTAYGNSLLKNYAEQFNVAIDAFLTRMVMSEHTAGPNYGAWPLLLNFCDRGPRSIALIVLAAVVDKISSRPRRKALAFHIGRQLEAEMLGIRIRERRGDVLFRTLQRSLTRKELLSYQVRRELRVRSKNWTSGERRSVGLLLLDLLAANTTLVEIGDGKDPQVLPTECVLELIRTKPEFPLPPRRLPSLVPPKPWTDVHRDGLSLVTSRKPMDLSHITAKSASTVMKVANVVEQQPMEMCTWISGHMREAWDADLPLFPVKRELPPGQFPTKKDMIRRTQVEESLQQAKEVDGYPIWLEHDCCFRGRLYCSSRVLGHQGPDFMKAMLLFGEKEPVDDEGFRQLLMSAAGHYGLDKKSWAEREEWARNNLQLMQAIAESPLDRMDLWKGASAPWQFVQSSRAVAAYLEDPTTPLGVPIRFDQTCSGLGIIAALTRNRDLARTTNLIGSTRKDVYEEIAALTLEELQRDLHGFDLEAIGWAEFWLKFGVNRSLCKGPVLTSAYGSRHFGITEGLVDVLQEANPGVPVAQWADEYTRPAKYLAKKLLGVIKFKLKSSIAMETWLRTVVRHCLEKKKRVRWTTPMGFPVSLGSEIHDEQYTRTLMHGSRKWQQVDCEYEPGQLSARQTAMGICANTCHTFDASFVHQMILTCADHGMPILSVHDCFTTIPSRAAELHRLLLSELRSAYAPDWLSDLHEQISANAGVELPPPPHVNDLCHGEIGQNTYCFS